jgi:hypothetical protein
MLERFDLMLEYFRKGWVPMLEKGDTFTIWETWSKDGSECHAWCATPAYDLSTDWLGVRPLGAGFAKVMINPTFHDLDWVKGVFPSCKGDIRVEWKKSDQSTVDLVVILPDTLPEGMLKLPSLNGVSPRQPMIPLRAGENHFTLQY